MNFNLKFNDLKIKISIKISRILKKKLFLMKILDKKSFLSKFQEKNLFFKSLFEIEIQQ